MRQALSPPARVPGTPTHAGTVHQPVSTAVHSAFGEVTGFSDQSFAISLTNVYSRHLAFQTSPHSGDLGPTVHSGHCGRHLMVHWTIPAQLVWHQCLIHQAAELQSIATTAGAAFGFAFGTALAAAHSSPSASPAQCGINLCRAAGILSRWLSNIRSRTPVAADPASQPGSVLSCALRPVWSAHLHS